MTDDKPPSPDLVPEWADLSDAQVEHDAWPDKDHLQGIKRDNDILWHKVYGKVVVGLMLFFVTIFVLSLGAWIFHYITPWQFLNEEQLSKIQSVVFSGTLGAIVSAYMQKQLAK